MCTEIAQRYPDSEHIINALVDYELSRLEVMPPEQIDSAEQDSNPITLRSLPVRYNNLKLRTVEADYDQILDCLRRSINFSKVRREKIHLVMRLRESQLEIIRIPPLATEIFQLCNGKRTISAVLISFAKRYPVIDGMSGSKACLYGVNLLVEKKLIRIAPPPGI